MTPGEWAQKETDRQSGLHERRMMDRARFGSPLAAELFSIVADAGHALAQQVREEQAKNVAATQVDELRTEGRVHVNTRPQRHE